MPPDTPPKFVKWDERPEFQRQEALRLAREKGTFIVKVVYTEGETEAKVARKGGTGLRYQPLSDGEKAQLVGVRRAYFEALWSNEEVRWILLEKIQDQPW